MRTDLSRRLRNQTKKVHTSIIFTTRMQAESSTCAPPDKIQFTPFTTHMFLFTLRKLSYLLSRLSYTTPCYVDRVRYLEPGNRWDGERERGANRTENEITKQVRDKKSRKRDYNGRQLCILLFSNTRLSVYCSRKLSEIVITSHHMTIT